MFDIEKELAKYGLDDVMYEQILLECSNKVQGISELDWADIVDKYNLNIHYDSLRKSQQLSPFGGAFVSEYYKQKKGSSNSEEYLEALKAEKREIQKEKRKLFDERLDINRTLRKTSRIETTIERIDKMLSGIADSRYIQYVPDNNYKKSSDLIVCLSDLHIGASYYGFSGCYDSDIAKERLNAYLKEVIEIQKTHYAENCICVLCGDIISGSIHKTISVTNKENVIEQVKLACEYLSDFIYELGKHFKTVEVRGVSGNHSRIEDKEDALLGERLDTLIVWFIKSMLKNAPNITVEDENIDDTLSAFMVRDKLYFAIHGDFDSVTESSIAKLALWAKMTPYCVICGHKHHPAMNDFSGIKVVQSGCLGGSGDEYTRQKRLTGNPSQTVLVVDNRGIKCCYPVELD